MKKALLLSIIALFMQPITASTEVTFFDPKDVDSNGWLWFDTQEKINRYVGITDDKLIQLVSATYENADGENPEPFASATIVGAGTDGEIGTTGSRKGAIVLCESDRINNQSGGAIMLHLPSCTDMALSLSSTSKMLGAIYAAPGVQEPIDLGLVVAKSAAPFVYLSKEYVYTFSNMATISNDFTGNTIKSDNAVTVLFRNCQSEQLFIHGIKVMVKDVNGIKNVQVNNNDDDAPYYTIDGVKVEHPPRGIYIRNHQKVFVK